MSVIGDSGGHKAVVLSRHRMPRIIEIIVSPQGQATIQTKGYAGADCQNASEFLELSLGTVVTDRKTAEFYQSTVNEQHLQQ